MKIYGNEKTHLTLSDKAQEYYDITDPLHIEEYKTIDGYRYNIKGCFERRGITEEEVNKILEEDYDNYFDDDDYCDPWKDREMYSPSAPWNAPGMRISDFI